MNQKFQFMIWPFYCLTFMCDLDLQPTWTNVSNKQLCQIILKACLNVEVMARTGSIYDLWPSSVTLIFDLSKQMFQMALLLLKENNCVLLFWNPCIYVEIIARISSIYDHFIIWPSSMTLTFHLPDRKFQMELLLFKENNCAKICL